MCRGGIFLNQFAKRICAMVAGTFLSLSPTDIFTNHLVMLFSVLILMTTASASASAKETELKSGETATLRKSIGKVAEKPSTHAYNPFRFGYQYGFDSYEEPGHMKESGNLNGVFGVFETVFDQPQLLLRLNADVMFGTLNYDGKVTNNITGETSPYTTTSRDYIYNFKAVAGFPLSVGHTAQVIPVFGLATRYLDDVLVGSAGYEREITYYYIPVGVETRFFWRRGWAFGFAYEFDNFLSGLVKTHLSQVGFSNDLVNHQSSGAGHRFSLNVMKSLRGGTEFHFSPYLQIWQIKRSDYQELDGISTWNEPVNNTTQFGASAAIGL
jgi:hypothetical protein